MYTCAQNIKYLAQKYTISDTPKVSAREGSAVMEMQKDRKEGGDKLKLVKSWFQNH